MKVRVGPLELDIVGYGPDDGVLRWLDVVAVLKGEGSVVDAAPANHHMNERHEVREAIDQSYLPGILRDVERALEDLEGGH